MKHESLVPRPAGVCHLCFFAVFSFFATAARATDADGDGMEASWESANYLSDSDATDAFGDPDGDLLSNLGEYLTATDPYNPDSDYDGLNDNFNFGLDGWWQFSETAGTPSSTANTLSGEPSLTLNGASIATGGLFGNALKPTSYNQPVPTSAGVLVDSSEWSFSGWFKIDSLSTTNIIFSARPDSTTNTIGAHVSGGSWGTMTLYITLAGDNYSVPLTIAQNSNYHHLVVSRDLVANRAEVYFDGALVSSIAPASSPEPLDLASTQFKVSTREVTEYWGYYNYYLYGSMDEVRLYSRRLTGAEVDGLYDNGCTSTSAAKYWTIPYLLNNPLGQADSDSDGFTNLAEAIAGSDPNNSASKPVPATTGYQLHTKLG